MNTLILLLATQLGAPSLSNLCTGAGDAPVCGSGQLGTGWYLDNSANGDWSLYYLVGGVDWLRLDPGSTTLTFVSAQATSFVFTDNTTFSGTLTSTGALAASGALTVGTTLGVTGDATFSGGDGALTITGTVNSGPWFSETFNEGAAKGVGLTSAAGGAYSTTADAGNVLHYGEDFRAVFVTNTTATGTITPAGTATGLDLNAGAPGNSDEWTLTMGVGSASGGQIIPGTTPAWSACATINATTVSEAAGLWLLVTSSQGHVDLNTADPNYTSYVGIGIEQTDVVVSDSTTGATDTTDNAANGVSETWCILGSAAGVITYTRNGAAPTATDAHTLADGVPHVVRIQGLNHTGTEAPMNLVSLSLLPQ